ncbi:MAG: MarR family transcriptional regulator [Dehalococcoidales bacterium]|jgi:DNA-binding MarR family transcriptional regulator
MKKTTLAKSNFELWTLIGRVNHTILQLRQQELSSYKIPVRQLYVLRIIRALGENATLSEVAKQVERETHVISKQAIRMEKDGLIKRTKNTPKSNILHLELTEKGLGMAKMSLESKSLKKLFSSLSAEERRQIESILNKILIQGNAKNHW